MATIVLSAAASAAASALGAGVFLAGVSGMVGGYLGGFIDRSIFGGSTSHIAQEGSRVTDLMVQASTYGKVIPTVYGTVRIAGNLIWAHPIQEHVIVSTQSTRSGKGSRKRIETTSTSYTYTASFAIALCEGPIREVVRAWADAKPLDLRNSSYGTLYIGTEDQLPDTFMASFHPPGHTPAYRGLAYVVFKDFPLGDFGNRIPNFTFEVRRVMKKPYDLEDKIRDITLIPGAGEYVYDTVLQEKIQGEQDSLGGFVQSGKLAPINCNTLSPKADVLVALDQLKNTLPNVEWVSVVVNWFADSLDPAVSHIKPGVEFYGKNIRINPDPWAVSSFRRRTAHLIRRFPDGSPTYGGTPTDVSVLRLCKELKRRGYKVLLYPMLQVDTVIPQSKPWRGRITSQKEADVDRFFTQTHGYNAFITHYAGLSIGGEHLRDSIDAFMLGSEFVGLTQYMSSPGVFPAVYHLKQLARPIKTILGSRVQLTYGADWTEYHSTNGWYNLDFLWADPHIDMVAIDCYVPLTPDLPQCQITYEKVYVGWNKDEGWDCYWDASRVTKTSYTSPTYAWKNIKHWWSTSHVNPDGSLTPWIPKMKPLWFSELGFPSVDGAANQPNVFVDPDSIESFYPRGSRQRVDFRAQRIALEASLDYLKAQNTLDKDFVPRSFVWTWDARPFPAFPDLTNVWSDGRNWKTGHWLQGKLGSSSLAQIVSDLLQKVGYEPDMYDTSRLTDQVSGFIITNRQTVRGSLEQLATAYLFDMVESDGILKFIKRGQKSQRTMDVSELVPGEDASQTFSITRRQEMELPRQVDVITLNPDSDYQSGTQSAQRHTGKAVDYATLNLPLVLNDQEAKTLAEITLAYGWVGRVHYKFALPPQYALYEPTDVITITKDGISHVMRITGAKMIRHGMQEITAVAEDISSYEIYIPPVSRTIPVRHKFSHASKVHLELLDLPALPTDSPTESSLTYGAISLGENWKGVAVYGSDDGGENYDLLTHIVAQSPMGSVLNSIPPGPISSWDMSTTIDVLLMFGELQSITDLAVLNGGNVCVIGDEILQFQSAILIDTNKYRLSHLLRGRLGTEWAISDHKPVERFILLDSSLRRETVGSAHWDREKQFKPIPIGSTLGGTHMQKFTYRALALKPYSPVHITGERDENGTLTIRWKRRTRMNGDWRDGVDVPLAEESERYEMDIMSGKLVKRTLSDLAAPTAIYTSAQQISDFGSTQRHISVNVYQISALVGRGYAGQATV